MRNIFSVFLLISAVLNFSAEASSLTDNILDKFTETFSSVPENIKTVAVFKIEGLEKEEKKSFQHAMEKRLIKSSGRFTLIDRETVDVLLKEQAFSMSGTVDKATMIKAGRLIGVQGYFMVHVTQTKLDLKAEIKLVDVETGAVVYLEEFSAEKTSFNTVGFSLGYCNAPPVSIDGNLVIDDGADITFYEGELEPESAGRNGLSFMLYFVNALPKVSWLKFGTDMKITGFFPANQMKIPGQREEKSDIPNYTYELGFAFSRAFTIGLSPMLYFDLNRYLDIGLGLDASYMFASANLEGWWNRDSDGQSGDPNETDLAASGVFAPIVGVYGNVTRGLTIYCSCTYQITHRDSEEGKENMWDDGWNYRFTPVFHKGPRIDAGVKVNIFRW